MSDTATWPDPSRPGVPLHPERTGAHWIDAGRGPECAHWIFDCNKWRAIGSSFSFLPNIVRHWCYLGPALTPAEHAAAIAAAFDDGARAMREAAARDVGCGCDNRDAVVSARSNAERSRLCGRAPCAALLAMDIRMLPLPAMEKEPSVERAGMAVVGPDERRVMDDALRRSVTITDDCAAAVAEARRAALEEAARVAEKRVARARELDIWGDVATVATNIATAIRALAAKEPGNE